MQIEALLCDAATVRENLLHILGGGINRIWRPSFPAPLGVDLALVLTLSTVETQEQHRIRVVVQTADGRSLAEIKGEFGISPGPDVRAGERLAVPLVLPLKAVQVPAEGIYSVEVLVDGQLQRSLTFTAAKPAEKA